MRVDQLLQVEYVLVVDWDIEACNSDNLDQFRAKIAFQASSTEPAAATLLRSRQELNLQRGGSRLRLLGRGRLGLRHGSPSATEP
ncbi:hypothetical protein LMTR13_09105 [Bradyrhizobium icense]|uniref:Uncharacterized protein n=1 Tax=Bradyrhizobium icense TaxID=1274631 RepID=A0A1B1UC26_9BRAD|nr:hypothetical protein LMTR13_09105 [Bradyrhizobium icense]